MREVRTKVVLALFLASAVVVLALSLYTGVAMNSLTESLDQSRSERLVAEAASASLIVSGQDLNDFNTAEDMQVDKYTQVVRRLEAFASLHNIREVFYLRQTPSGDMQYIISNLAASGTDNLTSAPIAPTILTQNAMQGAISVVNLADYKNTNSIGDLLAFAPVFDQSGRVTAVAGVGVSDDALQSVDSQIKNLTIILLACVAVVILAACANVLLQVRKENELQERVHQQTLMVDISRTLISNQEFDASVNSVLEETAVFLGAQRAYLLDTLDADQSPELRFCWQSSFASQNDITNEISLIVNKVDNIFAQTADAGDSDSVILCNNTAKDHGGAYKQLNGQGILSFAWAPLYTENRLWGILLIDYLDEQHKWTNNERQLINSAANDLAGAIARERFDDEREQALDHAVKASEAKSEFLSNMSHEMRTPMNAIIGMTSIALGSDDPARKDYCLGHIKDASANLLNIINDVLDMSSLQSYSLELVLRPFKLLDAVKEAVDDVTYKINEHSQKLSVYIDSAIPEVLIGDKKRLSQVLSNFLSNANKFSADGSDIKIDIKHKGLDDAGHLIYFAVSDNGIGISSDQQKNLFASFEQADSGAARKYGGAGLGLAIARRIVELMHGHVSLESELDKGSTFFFTIILPEGNKDDLVSAVTKSGSNGSSGEETVPSVAFAAGSGEQGAGDASVSSSGNGSLAVADDGVEHLDLSNYHILLAEDIDINREVVFALLEDSGIQISVACNGIEALHAISNNVDAFDLVFMDLQMPEMDGLDATRRIRALQNTKARTLPIIAMTANVFQEDVDQCLAAGMNDHIGKPINLKEIYGILLKYLPEK